MPGFINRDPDGMIRYGAKAKEIVDQISAPDLDDPTQREIEQLHICCKNARKAFEKYYNTADMIEKKGVELKRVREGG